MTDDPSQWSSLVDQHIAAALEHTEQLMAPAHTAGGEVVAALRTSARGGKRMRAHLLLAAHHASGATDTAAAMGAAAALELFQSAALIHDDVIDDSHTRRGQVATHRYFASIHGDHGWQGSGSTFGIAGAILTGDVALLASLRCLHHATAGMEASSAHATNDLFHDMAQLVTMGQYMDVRLATIELGELADQLALIEATMRTKTATYTAEYPLALGAAIAGADAQTITSWRAVGVPLGVAFQIRDDVLGLVGTPDVTGKPVGDDVREGKRTVIVHHAWVHTDGHGREILTAALGNRGADDATIQAAVAVIHDSGAFAHAEQRIASLRSDATGRLDALVQPGPMSDYLRHIIDLATQRAA